MWKANVLLGTFTAALSGYVLLHSLTLTYAVNFGPGPGFAPWWLSLALLIMSVGYIAVNLFRREEGKGFPLTSESTARAAGLFLVFGATILVMELLGFVISMAIFLVAAMKLFEGRTWLFSLVVGTLCSASVYLLFAVLFKVPLLHFSRARFRLGAKPWNTWRTSCKALSQ